MEFLMVVELALTVAVLVVLRRVIARLRVLQHGQDALGDLIRRAAVKTQEPVVVKRSAPSHAPVPARPPPVPPVGSMPPRAVPVPVGPSPATPSGTGSW